MAWNEQVADGTAQTPPRPEYQSGGDYSGPPATSNIEINTPRLTDLPAENYQPGAGTTARPVNPLIQQGQPSVSQPAVAIGANIPGGPLAAPGASKKPSLDDDDSGVDDVVWVNRAKRVIAGTKGDPHRQVQLLQQLSVVYLKERYGRSVHADEV